MSKGHEVEISGEGSPDWSGLIIWCTCGKERSYRASATLTELVEWASEHVAQTTHACPPDGSGVMPCCGRTPFEAMNDRMTLDPSLVTCSTSRYP